MKNGLAKTNCLILLGGLFLGALFAFSGLNPQPVRAATGVNQTINFQGRLLNSQGAVVPDGFYNIEFKIYQDGDGQTAGDATGSPSGSLKWTEDHLNQASHGVKVVNGYLSVQLGAVTAFGSNIDWNQSTLWLSMNVAGTGASCTPFSSCTPDGEMLPMQPMTSSPYSLNSGQLGGLTAANFVQLAQGVQADSSTTNSSIFVNKTGTTANILELQRSGVDVVVADNTGATLFRPSSDSTTALQVQNRANGYSVFSVDSTGNQVVLGKSGNLTGKLAFATAGGGTLTINPTSSASAFTITLPAETGTVCTTAASGVCNTAGGLSNVAYLNQAQSFTDKNTFNKAGSGANDYTLGVTSTPSASSTSSLVRIGGTISSGNGAANGGTYLSIVEPSSGAGSAADFFNLQNGSTVEMQLTAGGNLTVNGTYNTNTFNSNTLGFGGNSAVTINSSGSNNITLDTGSSGGTLALGNNAVTTNLGTSNATHTIGIGTGGGGTTTQAVTIGAATNSSSTLTLQGGNGTGSISLLTGNNGSTAGSIQIGNTSGAFNQTISLGNNNSASNIVNIGTGSGQDSVTIGDTTNTNSSLSLKAGATGGISLGANTTLSANSNLTYTSGTGTFDAHNASGTFQTSTGANSLNGATTVTGTNSFTVNAGASTLNGLAAGSSTALKVTTNNATNTGVLIQGASAQTAPLLQLQDSNGGAVIFADVNGNQEQLGNHNTPYAGIGNYGNLILQSEQLGTTWTATNITVTQNDGASNPAPDGNTTADKLVSSASGTHSLTQTYSSAGNNTYTFSVWLKTATPPQPVQLRIDSNGTPGTGTAASFTLTGTWQRYAVTQTFSSGVSSVTPTLLMTNNSASVVGWGAQLIQGGSAGVYSRTSTAVVAAGSGIFDNQSVVFQALNNSTAAYQFQNTSGMNVAAVDTTNGQLVLGTASTGGITGKIKLFNNTSGSTGSITVAAADPVASNYTITLPAETGTVCTTAASAACTAVYAPAGGGYVNFAPSTVQADASTNNSVFINKTSGTGNIFELQKSGSDVFKIDNAGNVASTGQNTLSRNGSGSNDYTLGLTGTPTATGTSALLRLGNALTSGNGAANGGTYLSIVQPSSGAGSAADFFNLQNGSTVEMQLTAAGNLTVNGTYNTNTFNSNTLGFGGNSAVTINSSGVNNITLDTGSSGGILALGNNAATTNLGTSNAAHTIGIGTGGGGTTTQAVTIGAATNSSSTLTLQGGNGTGSISLLTGNNGSTAGSIQIGNTSGAFNQTINIGTNNAASDIVNVGTGTGQDSVTIGDSTNANSSVAIKAGSTGGISLGANTTLSANSNLTYASGTGAFDAHNASGTFQTSTGANSLNGATTVTGTNSFTVNGGASTLNGLAAGSSTALKVVANNASNNGVVVQGAASQVAPLLQLQDSTGASLLAVGSNGDLEQIGNHDTPFGGIGNYGNLILQSEQLGTTWTATNITVTQNDAPTNPAPDGNTTADKLVSSASGSHTLTQTYSSAGNNTYTFSVWLKTSTATQAVQLRIDSNGTPSSGTAASYNVTTSWQRYTVSQTFSSGVTTITPTLVMVNNNADVEGWGAQLILGSRAGVYSRTTTAVVSAASGFLDNQNAVFQALNNSTAAYQFQNNAGINVAAIDTTNGQVVLGTAGASGVTGQIKFNFTGQTGSITLAPLTPSSTAYTINLPAENGTVCTTAAAGVCSAAGSGFVQLAPAGVQADATNNNSVFINKTSGTGNIFELQKSGSDVFKVDNSGNLTGTGQSTLTRNGTGAGDSTLGVTGTTSASATSSLVRLGNAISGGNSAANGGTYLGINLPSSGGGSAADFFNLQNNNTVEMQLTAGGNLTVNGTYNTNTFNGNTLGFGGNSAVTINSSGTNNITLDTGSSGGILALGNNAATTNLGTSNAAHTIGIGTGGGGTTTQAVTLGAATNSSSTLTLQGGNGTGSISLLTGNNGSTAGSIQIGNTTGGFSQTINIGTNGTTSSTNVVNIGTGGGTSGDSVTIGSSSSTTNSVTINGGTGLNAITLGANTTLGANNSLTYAAGNGNFDAHNSTGTFQTSTGTNSLNGTTTVTGTNSFNVNAGASTLNGLAAGSSTALKVTSGAASNVGATIQGASSQTGNLLQLQDSTGGNVDRFDASGNLEVSTGYVNTAYGGYGAYSNLLVRSEDFSTTWTTTGTLTVSANDGASNPAPDGNTTADKLAATTNGAEIKQAVTTSTTGNYTFSAWIKTNSSVQNVDLRIDSTGTNAQTGTVKTVQATTTWQRFSITQNITGPTISTIVANIFPGGVGGQSTVVAWGAQLVTGTSPQVYTRTTATSTTGSDGLIANGSAIFQAAFNSTTSFQVQNASGVNVLVVDSSNRQLKIYENNGSTNYAQIYYDTATSTANYTANSGTVAVGAGAGGISVISGSGSSITITGQASSTWQTAAGSLTLESGTSDLILTARGTGSLVNINNTAALKLGSSAGDPSTCTAGAVVYNSSTHTLRGCQGSSPTWNDLVNVTPFTLQQNYTASTGGSTPEIKVDATRGSVDIQDANTSLNASIFNVRDSNSGGLGTILFGVSTVGSGDIVLQDSNGTGLLEADGTNQLVQIGDGAAHSSNPIILVLDNYQPTTAGSEPTEADGAMYYDADNGLFRCGLNGYWQNCGVDNIQSSYNFTDDFLSGGTATGGIGDLGWAFPGAGACGTQAYNPTGGPTISHDHPGVLDEVSTATSNQICVMQQASNAAVLGGAGDTVKMTVAEGASTNSIMRVGLTNQTSATSTTRPIFGAWWEADNTSNTHWQYCYGNGTTATCSNDTNGTPTITANAWNQFEIHIVSATAIDFIYNGTVVSLTGISPSFGTAGGTRLTPTIACGTRTTTAMHCYTDYYQWTGIITTSGGR